MSLRILYRGPLESCNYGCDYCPFAKRKETRAELQHDRHQLERFVTWALAQTETELSVFFTPWGEALVRPWYRWALTELSRAEHVSVAAIQTNLSAPLDFIDDADPASVGIWATYHPEWTDRAAFVERIFRLHNSGARVSAGVVGFKKFLDEIYALRAELPEDVYLWINAAKSYETYTRADVRLFEDIDPLFAINTIHHPSKGFACRAGHSVIAVDGEGTARRCHFIDTPIGNIYDDDFALAEGPLACTNETCGCHIGYVHLEYLELDQVFASGILERVPSRPVWKRPSPLLRIQQA